MKRVALIGMPLRRRHSQVVHDAAFAAAGIDARYELHEIAAQQVPDFVRRARGPEWLGFQVTAPYKQAVVPLLDEVEPAAQRIGAVNSVQRLSDGRLVGFNTDAPGFAAAVGIDLDGAEVVVIGAGGAARAVVAACERAARLTIANRTAAKAEALAEELGGIGCGLDDPRLATALGGADLLVSATTVGTAVDLGRMPAGSRVFDLVYVPAETELLARARARGLRTVNGLGMLVAQAGIAFQRWTGAPDPSPVMAQALTAMLESAY